MRCRRRKGGVIIGMSGGGTVRIGGPAMGVVVRWAMRGLRLIRGFEVLVGVIESLDIASDEDKTATVGLVVAGVLSRVL